jgi:hypothetical protein
MAYEDAATILARWREVERLLESADSGSDEAEELAAEAAALRERLRRATEPEAAGDLVSS